MRRLWILALLFPVAASAGTYFSGAVGFERSGDTVVRDIDCSSAQPPALFGCVEGSDGRSLAARGDFGRGPAFEIGAGRESGRTRIGITLGRRALDLDADANFPGVSGEQPVSATAHSLSALVNATIDLADWRIRPFVTAGAGAARNESGSVRYAFPGISPEAVTVIRGGANTEFAWTAGAGVSMDLAPSLTLDLTLRWTDLGELRTEAGSATIIRPTRELTLDIAGTRARVRSTGVMVGLRWRMGV